MAPAPVVWFALIAAAFATGRSAPRKEGDATTVPACRVQADPRAVRAAALARRELTTLEERERVLSGSIRAAAARTTAMYEKARDAPPGCRATLFAVIARMKCDRLALVAEREACRVRIREVRNEQAHAS